jgi:flagellar assembly protein FliH
MEPHTFTPDEISRLVDRLIESKDPSVVGLRRILKRKKENAGGFPLRAPGCEEFYVEGKSNPVLDDHERSIVDLERKVLRLQSELAVQRLKAEEALQTAYAQGIAAGKVEGDAAGFARGHAECAPKLAVLEQQIADTFAALEQWKRDVFRNAEHLVTKLACEIARKIISAELALNPEIIAGVVKKTLSFIADRERLIVRVAPQEIDIVKERQNLWLPAGERLRDIQIVEDPLIQPGGCVIESNTGTADARLGVQFEELAELVEKAWRSLSADEPAPSGGPDAKAPDTPGTAPAASE